MAGYVFMIVVVLFWLAVMVWIWPIHPKRKPHYRHRCHSCGEIYVSDEDNAVCPVCGEKF